MNKSELYSLVDIDIRDDNDSRVWMLSLVDYDIVVSYSFRDALKFYSPNIFENQNQLRLLTYLLFTTFLDEETRNPIIARGTLAALRGEFHRVSQGRFTSRHVLDEFRDLSGLELDVTPYNRDAGKAHTACLTLPPALEQKYQQQLAHDIQEVYLVSGQPYSARARLRERQKAVAAAKAGSDVDERPNARTLYYLRSIPANGYRQFEQNLDKAKEYVLTNFDGLKREHQLRVLKAVSTLLMPRYQQVDNTERLYR